MKNYKAKIDNMDMATMLEYWAFAPAGDPLLEGPSGDYFRKRLNALRRAPGGEEKYHEIRAELSL